MENHVVRYITAVSYTHLDVYKRQVGQRLGAAFAAAKYPSICQIANDTADAGVMPHFTRSRPIAEVI